MILHNTKEGEYIEDKQILEKLLTIDTKDILLRSKLRVQIVTEDYKSWNYLKEYVSEFENLQLSEKAIEFNPKSYDSWYHRYFNIYKIYHNKEVFKDDEKNEQNKNFEESNCINDSKEQRVCFKKDEKSKNFEDTKISNNIKETENISNNKNTKKEIFKRDVLLCKFLLSVDKRNLHCWNYLYKTYINLNFLEKDVLNYTYLHYCGSYDSTMCIFTDVKNIGMWFYYFVDKEKQLKKYDFYIRKYASEIEIIFKEFVNKIKINEKDFDINIPVKFFSFLNKNFINEEKSIGEKNIENNSVTNNIDEYDAKFSKNELNKQLNNEIYKNNIIIEINETKYRLIKYVNEKNEKNFNLLNMLEKIKIYIIIFLI
ncbi:protein prenyltransferase subunit alpha [Vairimorpha apis BRL 01]|uniref:Protein prenyltransferase subunit alpha n=1 Tax=Vairimorpha apis BRL 01 TaxID=1037528 RepID=T0MJL8_9MICR|nr:protein prenyltransferase subunit alpha [Vairimorpha apis BRL 01]